MTSVSTSAGIAWPADKCQRSQQECDLWNQFLSSEYFSNSIVNFHCAQLNLRPSKFVAHKTDVLCPSDCDFPLQPAWWTGFRSAVASSRFIPYNGVQTPTVCCALTVRHETVSLSRLGLKAQDYGKFRMRYASRSVCILVRSVRMSVTGVWKIGKLLIFNV